MTKLTARRTMLTTSGLGLALFIAGCSGSGGASDPTGRSSEPPAPSGNGSSEGTSAEPSAESSATASDSPDSSPSSSSSTSGSGSAEQTTVEIGEKFSDPATEDKVEILSVIRNFPSKEMAEDIADGGEVVLVQVKVTPGKKFGGAVSEGSFQISWDDGGDFWSNKTRMVEDELKAADLELFDRIARRDGGSKSGWIGYVVKEKADTYQLEYTRRAAKVIGQDKTIKEFTKQVKLAGS